MPSDESEVRSVAVLAPSPLFRAGLVALLGTMGFEPVAEAAALQDLKDRVPDARPGILLISLMRGDDPSALMREVKAWAPQAKVVFLAPAFDIETLNACFAAGAAGYVVESISRDALQHSLLLVQAGEIIFPSGLASELSLSALKASIAVERTELRRNLPATAREIEVLRCIANGESNSLIGKKLGLSKGEVSTHVRHLLKTLRVSNRTQVALWGVAKGLTTPLQRNKNKRF